MRTESAKRRLHPRIIDTDWLVLREMRTVIDRFAEMVVGYWSKHHYGAIGNVRPAVIGTTLIVLGAQNVLGGFLLGIVNRNEAAFLSDKQIQRTELQNFAGGRKEDYRAAAS